MTEWKRFTIESKRGKLAILSARLCNAEGALLLAQFNVDALKTEIAKTQNEIDELTETNL